MFINVISLYVVILRQDLSEWLKIDLMQQDSAISIMFLDSSGRRVVSLLHIISYVESTYLDLTFGDGTSGFQMPKSRTCKKNYQVNINHLMRIKYSNSPFTFTNEDVRSRLRVMPSRIYFAGNILKWK